MIGDYQQYRLSLPEWIEAYALGVCAAGTAAYACYRSWVVFAVLLVPAALVPRYMREVWKKKRLRQLELQFKEAIQHLSAALGAGYSVENAVTVANRELEMIYGPKGMICRELAYMEQQMKMNCPIELLMNDLGRRSGLEDIENFAKIFQIAKRSGGQLVPVICHTVQIMEDRFQVKEEIRTLTTSRQFEQKVMNATPILMIFYIEATSPGFFDVMYTTILGRVIMTVCLAVYLLACWMSKRILDIAVM